MNYIRMLRSGYMRKIYTGIDIASDGIKIVVSELFNNKFHFIFLLSFILLFIIMWKLWKTVVKSFYKRTF